MKRSLNLSEKVHLIERSEMMVLPKVNNKGL